MLFKVTICGLSFVKYVILIDILLGVPFEAGERETPQIDSGLSIYALPLDQNHTHNTQMK